MNNIILGTGMTAKIFAFYNREFIIIGKNVSLVADPILKNMIFLQDNIYNRQFLSDLIRVSGINIDYSYKNVDVLTFDGKDNYIDKMSNEEKKEIINKKLTSVQGKKLDFKNNVFQENLKLSEEKNSILKTIEVSFEDITKALDKVIAGQIVDESKVLSIDLMEKEITTEKGKYNYKDLVNTLSLDKFSALAKQDFGDLSTLDTTTVQTTEEEAGIPKIPYKDCIVYFPQDKFEFSKIVKREGKCYCEITGNTEQFKEEKYKKSISKNARLIKKSIINNFPGLIFLGRYSEWDPDCRIQDIVRRASNKFVMQNIWSDQKAFSSKFFKMEPDLKLIQENLKEMTLLMMQETYDFLNTINWKKHGEEKKLNLEEIKSEWIDIYKYWLSAGINLGLTFEDFLDAYEKNGIKIREKFKNGKTI